MTDYGKIIEALKVIKETCESAERCAECPLGEGIRDCALKRTPECWEIERQDNVKLIH